MCKVSVGILKLSISTLSILLLFSCDKTDSELAPQIAPTENAAQIAPPKKPNILLIVADDLGYTDLGVYGSEIDTPTLDALASGGTLLTNFHSGAVCSPTRSMLLSGTDNHLAGIGNMAEAMAPNQLGQPGYEGYLNFRVVSLPTLLKDANYHTYMAGKWHLGLEEETSPLARGFERSFALLNGGGGHFNDMGVELTRKKVPYREDKDLVALPDDFYSTRTYTDKLIEYISSNQGDGQPFFAYLAYTAPHWPLQAPDASIAKYKGKYDAGYDVIHAQRIVRMKDKGLLSDEATIAPRLSGEPAWEELSPEQKLREARMMEIYAAMVDDLDVNVKRVLDHLREIDELDNTFIFFMSDNGAESAPLHNWPVFGDWIKECCDNSYENMGKPNSYLYYGQNWGRVSTGPFRAYKGYTSEGGIRVPAFANYPGLKEKGITNTNFASVKDVMPTLLALAGIQHPGNEYKGREILPMQGVSLLPILNSEKDSVHSEDDWMGWEAFGRQSITQGDWKLLLMEEPWGNGEWQLYNLENDPAEQYDLSSKEPDRMLTMIEFWNQYASENGIIPAEDGTVF
ncbi:MAG: arylsulfatase A-like enzyme [Gammaproteobacteria bacterium]|jgi:arylsulfatase A-like enzyme